MFYCSLDAEGAFDFLPHCVILQKSINIISDKYWRLLVKWYSAMCAYIHWNSCLGSKINIKRGTRQGGLTSAFMFNLFYQDLIESLNDCYHGISIGCNNFNAICYADDILLCSVTSSGLQHLIDRADVYIKNHGLNFNPVKTECMIYGANPFVNGPSWILDNTSLNVVTSIRYLGTTLSYHDKAKCHILSHNVASQKAFYSLQGAGLKFQGISPELLTSVYHTAVTSILSYGCSSVYMSKSDFKFLDTIQGKHIKCMLGLKFSSRSTPLLRSLAVLPVSTVIMIDALNLYKSCLSSSSSAGNFYKMLLLNPYNKKAERTLMGRVLSYINNTGLDFISYLCNNNYVENFKQSQIVHNDLDGLCDSIRLLVFNGKYDNSSRALLQNLLNTF